MKFLNSSANRIKNKKATFEVEKMIIIIIKMMEVEKSCVAYFQRKPVTKIFVVGAHGSGKSTLINILQKE